MSSLADEVMAELKLFRSDAIFTFQCVSVKITCTVQTAWNTLHLSLRYLKFLNPDAVGGFEKSKVSVSTWCFQTDEVHGGWTCAFPQ